MTHTINLNHITKITGKALISLEANRLVSLRSSQQRK